MHHLAVGWFNASYDSKKPKTQHILSLVSCYACAAHDSTFVHVKD